MILVTGATGNIGSALVRQLAPAGVSPLRALTRDPARAALPAGVAAVAGDLAAADSLKYALNGVRSLFLPSGLGADAEVLAAAREAGVERVVLVSSITVVTHPHLPQAAANAAVERALRDSGMAWTVLRPTQFASNALWWADTIRAGGTVRLPYPDVGLPTIHPADIASVAGAALTEPGHLGRTYALTGPARVTAREQVETIAAVTGRDVPWQAIDRETAHAEMRVFLGAEVADAVLDLMGGDANEQLLAVRDTVPEITGTPGRTFRQWAEENAAAFAPLVT
ncbi:NAD-dependent epimerase/dehydratase family protein [Streptomyces sp. 8K308]|uniref:SDR family oxidoreductase n=1 Tax=Streptomyces sp. 8K308 TaxID=2530388 RepID=UPI001043E597|nr:NAD(P)H-binding protein [Streptomyces sp. 8K308]TDC24959.1 NAD-dependent epimerase/dehydratase family protein [Streptomyces sp. 8K308]